MRNIRSTLATIRAHRLFVPLLVASCALTLGILFGFEHSRNLLKVRGPYVAILAVVVIFPIFAFRFFDPQDDARPIGAYFVLAALYYIFLGSPNIFLYLRLVVFEIAPPGALRQLLLGLAAFAGIAGIVHYSWRLWARAAENGEKKILAVSRLKLVIYAVLQIVYLNLFVALVREKFGIHS